MNNEEDAVAYRNETLGCKRKGSTPAAGTVLVLCLTGMPSCPTCFSKHARNREHWWLCTFNEQQLNQTTRPALPPRPFPPLLALLTKSQLQLRSDSKSLTTHLQGWKRHIAATSSSETPQSKFFKASPRSDWPVRTKEKETNKKTHELHALLPIIYSSNNALISFSNILT